MLNIGDFPARGQDVPTQRDGRNRKHTQLCRSTLFRSSLLHRNRRESRTLALRFLDGQLSPVDVFAVRDVQCTVIAAGEYARGQWLVPVDFG